MSVSKKRKLNGEEPPAKSANDVTDNDSPRSSTEPSPAAVSKSFADLGVMDSLCEACESLGYKAPTPVQAEAIPLALQGRDIIGIAETGSGKTAAFALPILQALMNHKGNISFFGLVLAPTRELAYQISQQFEALGSLISVKCAVLVGGMDMVSQSIALGKKPHVCASLISIKGSYDSDAGTGHRSYSRSADRSP